MGRDSMILPQLAIFIDAAIPHQADLRAVILITALLADAVFGEPHPVAISAASCGDFRPGHQRWTSASTAAI